jgi:hypothetical protein
MSNLYSVLYKACIYASSIAFIIAFFTSSSTSFGAYVAGYSVLTLGLCIILLVLFSNILKTSSSASIFQILHSILSTTGPFILMLGIVSFMFYLMIYYKNSIIKQNTAPGYDTLTTLIVILLLSQLYIVVSNVDTEKFDLTGKLPKMISSFLYLLGTITAISSIVLYRNLKYASTDGFMV